MLEKAGALPTPKRYELVLLDADGTLFDYHRAEAQALERAYGHLGLSYDPGRHLARYRAINDELWADLEQGKISQAALRTERFRRLFWEDGVEVELPGFSRTYLGYLGEGAFLLDGAEETCRYLAAKYRLAIVTNGIKEVQAARLSRSPLAPYISHLIISEDAGCQKPDPGIFDFAFRVTGHTQRHTVIMVGDSLTADILGGVNYGIDTCWYNPDGRPLPAAGACRPTFEIRHLYGLTQIL